MRGKIIICILAKIINSKEKPMKKKIIYFLMVMVIIISSVNIGACGGGYRVVYTTDGNGIIQGESEQNLRKGQRTSKVTAVPNEGYEFEKWSDERTEPSRTDKAEVKELKLTALFKKRQYTVKYEVTHGGTILGESEQTVEHGKNSTEVTATNLMGYRFIKWSDNESTNPVRTDENVTADIEAIAIFEQIRYDVFFVEYETDGNGKLEGQQLQQIQYGQDGTKVTAIADDGYEFVQWSDGVKTAERQDFNVCESFKVTAEFKRLYVRYKLDYKLGKANPSTSEFIFYEQFFNTVLFPVPKRERFTFEGWYLGETRVTDRYGKMVIGKELLKREGKVIYAKWKANENYTYKILMVYVTELDALILRRDESGYEHVYYKMSEFDKEICKTTTKQVRNYMNDLLDGLVTFEVDEYSVNGKCSCIFANKIPEMVNSGLLEKYQSTLLVFCMDDFDYKFRGGAGVADVKHGCVYLESVYKETKINDEPLEYLLDLDFWRWYTTIEPFMHELAHTIEMQIPKDTYHTTLYWWVDNDLGDHILLNKMYYLDLIEIDGVKVGIPLSFWKRKWE